MISAPVGARISFCCHKLFPDKLLELAVFDYPASKDAVTCQTKMIVHLPVPFPGISDVTFMAKDVEPIVVK